MVHQSWGRRAALISSGMISSKFEHAEAERRMRGGFVLAVGVLVAGVVGVDHVDVVDAAGEQRMNSTWFGKVSFSPSWRAPMTPTIWPWQVSY
jgi:hypothetical protein